MASSFSTKRLSLSKKKDYSLRLLHVLSSVRLFNINSRSFSLIERMAENLRASDDVIICDFFFNLQKQREAEKITQKNTALGRENFFSIKNMTSLYSLSLSFSIVLSFLNFYLSSSSSFFILSRVELCNYLLNVFLHASTLSFHVSLSSTYILCKSSI
jgi:hypothetical protein